MMFTEVDSRDLKYIKILANNINNLNSSNIRTRLGNDQDTMVYKTYEDIPLVLTGNINDFSRNTTPHVANGVMKFRELYENIELVDSSFLFNTEIYLLTKYPDIDPLTIRDIKDSIILCTFLYNIKRTDIIVLNNRIANQLNHLKLHLKGSV